MNKKHILLIENDDNELDFFSDALEESKLNFLCSTARSVAQAIRILKNVVPDIIFVDQHITGKSGTDFLHEFSPQKVPVILYSTINTEKNVHAKDDNISSYLQLPQNVRTMAVILQSFLL